MKNWWLLGEEELGFLQGEKRVVVLVVVKMIKITRQQEAGQCKKVGIALGRLERKIWGESYQNTLYEVLKELI